MKAITNYDETIRLKQDQAEPSSKKTLQSSLLGGTPAQTSVELDQDLGVNPLDSSISVESKLQALNTLGDAQEPSGLDQG
ncbi:MAG: hypothetical protein SFT93_03525 [Rickettsiaceae bacterium]|nr:hypothetical protein [Rickettsiaceae bacterium]